MDLLFHRLLHSAPDYEKKKNCCESAWFENVKAASLE